VSICIEISTLIFSRPVFLSCVMREVTMIIALASDIALLMRRNEASTIDCAVVICQCVEDMVHEHQARGVLSTFGTWQRANEDQHSELEGTSGGCRR
jgi:hypothetical protein